MREKLKHCNPCSFCAVLEIFWDFFSCDYAELVQISGKNKQSKNQEKIVDEILSLIGKLSLEGQAEMLWQTDLPTVTADD